MHIHPYDLIALLCLAMTISFVANLLIVTFIYCHFDERVEQLGKANRRLRSRLDRQEAETKKLQIFNPPAEEIAPPFTPMATEEVAPPAEAAAQPTVTPYAMYLDAHRQLWKLKVDGDDNSDYGEYLRGVMEECYAKLDQTEQENVERESADAWKHV